MKRLLYNIIQLLKLIYIPFGARDYLKKGCYKYNSTATILYPANADNRITKKLPNVFGEVNNSSNRFRKLFTDIFRFFKLLKSNKFNGNFMVISSSEEEFKFFDIEKGQLLTYYKSKDKFKRVCQLRREWAQYFRTIPFSANDFECTHVEPIIDSIDFDSIKAFNQIRNDYADYYKSINSANLQLYSVEQDILEDFSRLWPNENISNEIIKLITQTPIPICVNHGDLWKSNILYNGNVFYYLDFEQVALRFYVFDLLMYMLSDALLLHNNYLLKQFLEGLYDQYFLYVAEVMNSTFDVTKKEIYYALVVFELYKTRWRESGNSHLVRDCADLIR